MLNQRWSAARYACALGLAALLCSPVSAWSQSDPLASWNDGAAKKAIVDFVKTTTTAGSPGFVPPPERIATFDQDGTLWIEHPLYSQLFYILDRVPALVKAKPELATVEPFKTVMSGNREAMAHLTLPDLEKLAVATLTGMPVEQFQAEVQGMAGKGNGPALEAPISPT